MNENFFLRIFFFLIPVILGIHQLLNPSGNCMKTYNLFAKGSGAYTQHLVPIGRKLSDNTDDAKLIFALLTYYTELISRIFNVLPQHNPRLQRKRLGKTVTYTFGGVNRFIFSGPVRMVTTVTNTSKNCNRTNNSDKINNRNTTSEGSTTDSSSTVDNTDINKPSTQGSTMADVNEHTKDTPTVIYRKDYKPPLFTITNTQLSFDFRTNETKVKSKLTIERNDGSEGQDLVLNGVGLEISFMYIGTRTLRKDEHYTYKDDLLTIFADFLPKEREFEFHAEVIIHPEKNFALTGLYKSNGLMTTQCEATGFRHITFFLDRPDVMSKYDVTVCGDKTEYPVILSNGDKVSEWEDSEPNRYCVRYVDPFRKPCYLFALVAGKLVRLEDSHTTKYTKRNISLYVYSEKKYVSRLKWALEALKRAIVFDEEYFHLEYDLSELNLVAVSDFNMGAMENKGLNIFNANSLVAAKRFSPDSAYERILTTVSHEYFHNWTGNRVTLRDWFQLTLKEGLTVFREQLFSQQEIKSDTYLLDNVKYIRSVQFLEDSSPVAHPIRPDSYVSMDNFYTSTVYEKGSQVMRMYHIILGKEYYTKGLEFYIRLNDGKGATCEDLNTAMESAYKLKKNDKSASLEQYMLWYSQSGTPHVTATYTYDAGNQFFHIMLTQRTDPTPDQQEKKPLFIPVVVGLIDPKDGKELIEPVTLELTEEKHTFTLKNIKVKPVPSVLRSFSAPVHFEDDLTTEERITLIRYDVDSFVAYNNATFLYMEQITKNYKEWLEAKEAGVTDINDAKLTPMPLHFVDALKYVLTHPRFDHGVKSYLLQLPTDKYIMNRITELDTDVLYDVKHFIYRDIGKHLNEDFYKLFVELDNKEEDTDHFEDESYVDFEQINIRKLKNTLLHILCINQYSNIMFHVKEYSRSVYPTNMLNSIIYASTFDGFKEVYDYTYEVAKKDELLLNNWLRYVSLSTRDDIYEIINDIQKNILKDTKNPNQIRAVYISFTGNTKFFNEKNGKGYRLLADVIINTDAFNPQLASQLCRTFSIWTKLNKPRQELIVAEINRILATPNLSTDTRELLLRLINKL